MSTLYRKYRPQDFSQVIGQETAVTTLQNALIQNIPAHSYLFTGPRGTGKTSLARIFAKALNCNNRKGALACGRCAHCQAVSENQSLDIIEIDAASYTGVDNIRSLRETMVSTPLLGKYRIYIIDEVHMLSLGAFNALLKIMEEPPEHVIFLLATTELHKVPKTIVSRCQRFDLRRFTLSEIVGKLQAICKNEGIKADEEALVLIAKNSGGALRDAESLLAQLNTLISGPLKASRVREVLGVSEPALLTAFLTGYAQGDLESILLAIKKAEESGKSPLPVTQEVLGLFRNVLLYKAHKKFDIDPLNLLSSEEQNEIERTAQACSYNQLAALLDSLEETVVKIKNSAFGFLPLEIAFAKNTPPTEKKSDEGSDSSGGASSAPKKNGSPKKNASASSQTAQSVSREPGKSKILTLQMIEEKWPQIIEKVKLLNASLSVALQSAEPSALEKEILEIRVKYKFHQERLNERAHRLTLREACATILGAELNFSVITEPKREAKKEASSDSDPLVQHALELLGGSVI